MAHKSPILVIGAVLFDIIGTYKREEKNLINKTGKLNFSIGGVAFNIASNLCSKGIPVSLITCLKTNSISSKVISDILFSSRIEEHIYKTDQIEETGYLAHFCDKELETGITSSEIERIDLFQIKELTSLINKCNFLVIDTNLSTIQIQNICKIASNEKKQIFVDVVSDAKLKRIYNEDFSCKFEVVCIRSEELKSLNISIEELKKDKNQRTELCKVLNTKILYINSELKDYLIIKESGDFEPIRVDYSNIDIKNTLGANDALFSAICAVTFDKKSPTGEEVKMKITDWVSSILRIEESNFGGITKIQKSGRNEIYRISITILFLFASIFAMIVGTFGNINLLQYGIAIFIIALCGGASGALSRDMVFAVTNASKKSISMGYSIALGMIAGTLSSLIGILPTITSGSGFSDLNNHDLLPLMIFIISISTGIALDTFFDALRKRNPSEIVEIKY